MKASLGGTALPMSSSTISPAFIASSMVTGASFETKHEPNPGLTLKKATVWISSSSWLLSVSPFVFLPLALVVPYPCLC